MKEKKLIAMFITSIVAFVASLTISLGVTFALADPVAAVGLAEISYNITESKSASKQVVFDPVGAYNDKIEDAVIVNSYEDILYASESVCDSIKLLKVAVSNNGDHTQEFVFTINVEGKTNAVNYVKFAIVDLQTGEFRKLNSESTSSRIAVEAGKTSYFVVAGYVNDEYATEVVDMSSYMSMNVTVTRRTMY